MAVYHGSIQPQLPSVFGGVLLFGVSSGLGGTTPAAYAEDIVPPSAYGRAMGLLRTFGDLGFMMAPILPGWLTDTGGYGTALWFNAIIMIVSSLVFGIWAWEKYRRTVNL